MRYSGHWNGRHGNPPWWAWGIAFLAIVLFMIFFARPAADLIGAGLFDLWTDAG